ncbi:MAG: biotin--[acetyl-CoA-carboxylase] ligase [Blastocatellia bacterium]
MNPVQIIHRPPFIIHHYPTLGSTNDQLKQMTDAPEFTCVTADAQTAGRGRRDRIWHSAPGDGLYLSVLLRPLLAPERIPLLSLTCAVAVNETIAHYNPAGTDIKWPNDVLVNERKLSGILIEGIAGADTPRIIVGIGVNLNHRDFPAELAQIATSLAIECGRQIAVAEFRDRLLVSLARWYETLRHGNGHLILNRWQQLSSYAHGKSIVVTLDDEQISGVTTGLTESGALLVRTASGATRTIIAGEVSRLRSDDE